MTDYILYGTDGCHLCEEAELLIHQAGLDYQHQDILDDENLQTTYGLVIPVLVHVASQRSLYWPFTSEQLSDFLKDIVL